MQVNDTGGCYMMLYASDSQGDLQTIYSASLGGVGNSIQENKLVKVKKCASPDSNTSTHLGGSTHQKEMEKTIKMSMKTKTLFPKTDSSLTALTSANPSAQWYWEVGVAQSDNATNCSGILGVKITYYALLFQPQNYAKS